MFGITELGAHGGIPSQTNVHLHKRPITLKHIQIMVYLWNRCPEMRNNDILLQT